MGIGKVLIIYHSEHHGNTKKIAEAMASVLNAYLLPSHGQIEDISN